MNRMVPLLFVFLLLFLLQPFAVAAAAAQHHHVSNKLFYSLNHSLISINCNNDSNSNSKSCASNVSVSLDGGSRIHRKLVPIISGNGPLPPAANLIKSVCKATLSPSVCRASLLEHVNSKLMMNSSSSSQPPLLLLLTVLHLAVDVAYSQVLSCASLSQKLPPSPSPSPSLSQLPNASNANANANAIAIAILLNLTHVSRDCSTLLHRAAQLHRRVKTAISISISISSSSFASYSYSQQQQQQQQQEEEARSFLLPHVADAQAWLSAALTDENDCHSLALTYANLTTTAAMGSANRSGHGHVTEEEPEAAAYYYYSGLESVLRYAINLTSNALAMMDAFRAHGWDTSLWRPPTRLTLYGPLPLPLPLPATAFAPSPSPEAGSGPAAAMECSGGGGGGGHRSNNWWRWPAVTVAKDGSGDFRSVQAAVDAAPQGRRGRWYTIRIKEGVYEETVRVPMEKTKLAMVGDGMGRSVITGSRNAQMPGLSTYDTATVAVEGDGFVAVGMTFENRAGAMRHQAVALRVDSDMSAFYNCSILGYQDTLYVHSLRQFYRGCRIEGTIDFIFGNGAAVFQACTILFRPGLRGVATSVLTAQGRSDPAQTTALVFHDCHLDATPAYQQEEEEEEEEEPQKHALAAYLGRPWKLFSRTVFLKCSMPAFLHPDGWLPWKADFALATLFYAEYNSSGPGAAHANGRVPWSAQLSHHAATLFTIAPFIQGDRWLPDTHVPFHLSL